jgi:NADH-quinone oxidoreductase subunit H
VNYGLLILKVLVFPGLVFTAVVGLITTWIDRKVTARVQMRVGPPFLQPFYDIAKYMIKETCVPAGTSKMLFLAAPVLGLAAVTVSSTIIWNAILWPGKAFVGDLIVVLYLLTIPAIAVVLGSFASRNPIASLGGSREMKLIMSYELPFVLACIVAVIKAGSITFSGLLSSPAAVMAPSGILALIVAILCMQAKLTLVPFDMPEAETELTGGAYIEYSGPPLGIFKLTRAMMLFTMPMFLVAVLWGGIGFHRGGLSIVLGVLKYVGLVVITVLVRNTAPRVRIDHAVKFFWGPVSVVALLAVVLAVAGL